MTIHEFEDILAVLLESHEQEIHLFQQCVGCVITRVVTELHTR